jgi:hypothetical protein
MLNSSDRLLGYSEGCRPGDAAGNDCLFVVFAEPWELLMNERIQLIKAVMRLDVVVGDKFEDDPVSVLQGVVHSFVSVASDISFTPCQVAGKANAVTQLIRSSDPV